MKPQGRHSAVPIGILLAAVVVLAFVAFIGLGTPAATADPTPAATASREIAPGVRADCGRIAPAACERAIELARVGNEADLVGTTLIVVDDICAPEVMCDRRFPFDSMVVFVTAGGNATGWYAFHAFGRDASMPTDAEPWPDEIPRHVVDRIRAALASP